MKQYPAWLLFAVVACGGPQKVEPIVAEPPPVEDSGDSGSPSSEEEDGVEIVSTRGKIDPDKVTRAIEPHAGAIEACYADNVGRRKWLGGGVELRWDVAADGVLTQVRMTSSDLGAWTIEKCLLDIARGLDLGKPKGGKAHVSAPLSFSLGSGAVVWDEDQAIRAVGGKFKELGECAKTAKTSDPTNVTVTIYVGTRGKVQSVGFASPSGFDDAWADCAHGRAMAWALTDPRGKVAKLSFVYNPAAISEDGIDDEEM
ncbi:MAG TPA: AgmX/PglI C-terminal domain-containing protein [Kofleriaceae bacterium]|nr:AgmX/PglI C-terminal domain-containing protein [Kofleriaceae bacterium]